MLKHATTEQYIIISIEMLPPRNPKILIKLICPVNLVPENRVATLASKNAQPL